MKQAKKQNILFLAVIAVAIMVIGLLFYDVSKRIAVEMAVVSQGGFDILQGAYADAVTSMDDKRKLEGESP